MCLQGLDLFGSVEGHVAGCCEQGNELSFYVKCVYNKNPYLDIIQRLFPATF